MGMYSEDLGEVNSWREAVDIAKRMLEDQIIEGVATVSLDEFKSGEFVAIYRESLFPEFLALLPIVAESMYPNGERFRLVKQMSRMAEMDIPFLCIIYLRKGDQL